MPTAPQSNVRYAPANNTDININHNNNPNNRNTDAATNNNNNKNKNPADAKKKDKKKEASEVSCLNSFFKSIFSKLNGFLVALGLLLVALGLYFVFADWGNVDPAFFLGMGACVTLSGIIMTSLGSLGTEGSVYQDSKLGSCWTGRKMLAFYALLLFAIICAELFVISICLSVLKSLMEVYATVASTESSTWPIPIGIEQQIGEKFNYFFFGASTSCMDPKYLLFWKFIDQACPSDMSSTRCRGCGDNYVTSCYADHDYCMITEEGYGEACPYTMCRQQFLTMFITNLKPIAYAVVGFIGFQILLLLISFILLCYSKRDDIETQLKKSGTVDPVTPVRR